MTVLSGWKEIAQYLGRGVRTVQRWEWVGMPVHRPNGSNRSAVSALGPELDAWVASTPQRGESVIERLQTEIVELRDQLAKLRNENRRLEMQVERQRRRITLPQADQVELDQRLRQA